MLKKIDHIGIAVKDLDRAIGFYRNQLGLHLEKIETVEDQKVRVAFFPLGESSLELLQTTDPSGPVGNFIRKRGEGFHHLSFLVPDLEEALKSLKAKGVRLIDDKPRTGAGGARIAFVHPESTGGLLIELCEH